MDVVTNEFGGPILGGVLIGLAVVLLRVLIGRLVSVSAMVGSLIGGPEGPAAPSIAFIAGLILAPTIMTAVGLATPDPMPMGAQWWPFVAGGLLVGFGARLAGSGLVGAVWNLMRGAWWSIAAILVGLVAFLSLNGLLGLGGSA